MSSLSDRHRVLIARTILVVAALLGLGAVVVYLAFDPGRAYDDWVIHNGVGAVALVALAWPMVRAQPRNRAVWIFPWIALFQGLNAIGVPFADQSLGFPVSDLALARSVGTMLANSTWVPGIVPMVTLALLWFPDGQAVSRRWRPVSWLALGSTALLTVLLAWGSRPIDGETISSDLESPAISAAFLGIAVSVVLSVVALVVRYRRSRGAERRQFRWIAWASGVTACSWLVANAIDGIIFGFAGGPTFQAVSLITFPFLLGGYTIAIWRHQLFDIDVVISRTLLFGSLAVFIATVYVGVVFGIGVLIARQDSGNQALSLAATVVVAFLFQPARHRLEQAANRLVYGPRATPYEVLSDLSTRLGQAESTSGLLDRMVARLADGTGAEQTVLWRWCDPGYEPLACWPTTAPPEPASELDDDAVLIERAGIRLGALTITTRRGEQLNLIERRLVDDLAASAGLVMDEARLDAALADQAAALFRSRRRLVDAQDDERQRLEAQLQVGMQQKLSVVQDGLTAGAELAADDGLDSPIVDQLSALIDETETARTEIEALARGIYPPLLEAEGLTAAVENLAARHLVPVEVKSSLSRRFDTDIELAAYFCIAEALTNVAKYANANLIVISLTERDGLYFEVTDDGVGFAVNKVGPSGTGLIGLRDRLEAVGGELKVETEQGRGTTVAGRVAAEQPAMVR